MLEIDRLKKIDSEKMYKVYDDWPLLAKKQLESNLEQIDFAEPHHIVFAGMGGSGAINDIFSSILSKTNIHVDVVKGYLLPKTTDSESVVVTTSISGNTNETLTVLDNAHKIGCKTLAFSNGGKMESFCKNNKIHLRKIPLYHSPRASFTSFLYSMLKVLQPILPINESDISESLNQIEKMQKVICSQNLTKNNTALALAKWLPEIPLIYYPWGLEAAAIRFKNSLQENSKLHVIVEDVIEACHNGIVSWNNSTDVKPILVRGQDDYIKTKERWNILKEFFDGKNIEYYEIVSVSGSILTKLISLIYLFDFASIYKAAISGVNPTPVKAIEFIKNKL